MAYRKFLRRPRRKILRRRTTKRAKTVSTAVKRYVKRTIHKQIENKDRIQYAANVTIPTGLAGATKMYNFTCIPDLSQGISNGQRIGSCVKAVSGIIKGHVNLLPYDQTTNPYGGPVLVKMWLARYIGTNAQILNLPLGTTDVFFRGNGTSLGPQANTLDMSLPCNDDYFRVLETRQFELGATYGSATGPISSASYFDNSKMTRAFSFNWRKYTKSTLKYDDNASSYPTNHNIYLFIQPVYATGQSAAGLTLCEWHFVNTMKYEDA